ncbi:PPK2 family polyphosphate kinase [Segetibacter sp. 3557_3]|uniref:PPK2 family polyphosphate kinase n=1 Tax=Segetibacter sp. 3557_3 TaxID=2547429 RepID=UPI001FB616D0|nr:PPK2 family polyphosphate kinase [Segetibacter sp. 3557_3]
MIKLNEISTRAPKGWDKETTKAKTAEVLEELDDYQNLLYAGGKESMLIILQGMDASGKDGVIKNVFSYINPQGISVKSFKAPSTDELSHDFLWRIHQHAPSKGMIQLFNRSHYEDVLITRVHKWCDDETAYKRMEAINHFEELLQEHNDTTILKFYLHISREEQQQRFDERLKNPMKRWKHNPKDHEEAKLWDDYQKAYEDCFERCNKVPWEIVPADQNWYKEHLIATRVIETLKGMKLKYPE